MFGELYWYIYEFLQNNIFNVLIQIEYDYLLKNDVISTDTQSISVWSFVNQIVSALLVLLIIFVLMLFIYKLIMFIIRRFINV